MNLALYREFRPKNFDQVVGQDFIVTTLKNQIKTNRLTHAYLFCGPRGTGKTSCAKIFAKAVNCTHNQDGNPCEHCAECVALNETNTDIIEIDAASNNRVEEIRDLREKVKYPPIIGKYKVYIIDEVHMLTDSAFNALLKTLEEPPKHVIFILATTEVHKLPATILSRCTRFDFKLLSSEMLATHLKTVLEFKGIPCDEKSLHAIARAGEGSVRDTLSIADSVASYANYNITFDLTQNVLGTSDKENLKNILLSISNKDISALFKSIKIVIGKGKNIQILTKEMADLLKNLVMIKSGVVDYSVLEILPSELKDYSELSQLFDMCFLKDAFLKFAEIELQLKYSLNPENLFEATCLSLINYNHVENTTPIVENVKITPKEIKVEPAEQNEAEKIWGNVLIKVKEKNMFALSNALTSVNKVEKYQNKFIIYSNELNNYEMIDKKERIDVLLSMLKLFDDSISEVIVEYDKSQASKQDIKDNLKEIFKSKINFKE